MQGQLTHGPAGAQTATTDPGPLPNSMDREYYEKLMREAYAAIAKKQAAPVALKAPSSTLGAARPAARPVSSGGTMAPPTERGKSQLETMREEAEMAQLQAAMSPPPMRMTTFGGGTINGYMPDVNAMNAYQRKLFLPNESKPPAKGESLF